MVPKQGSDSTPNNVYVEYLYVNNQWEILGDTSVDVDGFITESDAQDLIDTAISNALQGYATESYVDGAISDALTVYADKTYVDTAVSNAYNTLDALIKLDYVVLT